LVFSALCIGVSGYYERRKRRVLIEAKRRILGAKVRRFFDKSRGSAGTRTLVSKQNGPHKYKVANVERLDSANTLDRKFDVDASNKAWCGDITLSGQAVDQAMPRGNPPIFNGVQA